MKIAIVTAIWKREALTRIFLNSVKRYWQDYGISTMIAGSEGAKTREMCLDAGAGYVETTNLPLSNKFNSAAKSAHIQFNPDAFMIMGSDDFVNDTLIKRYFYSLEQGYDIIGFRDCYFYHTGSREAALWHGYLKTEGKYNRVGETIGMARLISKRAFQKVKLKLWPGGMNSGLDFNMMKKLKRYPELRLKSIGVNDDMYVLVDIKGQHNITDFSCYRKNFDLVDTGVFNTIPEFPEIEKL